MTPIFWESFTLKVKNVIARKTSVFKEKTNIHICTRIVNKKVKK